MLKYLTVFVTIFSVLFSNHSHADDKKKVKDFVDDFGKKAISIASDKKITIQVKRDKLIDLVDSVVDSKWIAKFVLAKNYRISTQPQRDEFQKLYREFMIHTYAPSFKSYNGENFEVLGVMQQGKYFMVKCNFIPSEGPKVNVAFRLKKNKISNNFSVLDVVAEGVSLIETQRSEFGSVISKKGMSGFLADLDERVKRLKGNTSE